MFKNVSFRSVMLLIAVGCFAIFGYALYLQYVEGQMPCPMCIIQRYAFTGVFVFSLLSVLNTGRAWRWIFGLLTLIMAGFGAYVAAQQSWLQWHPPVIETCGRDFYSMVDQLPISRAIPLIFQGSGSCAEVNWTFMGLSIANLSFIAFVGMALLVLLALFSNRKPAY